MCQEWLALKLFFFQAEDGIRGIGVTGVQTCALPIFDNPRTRHRWEEAPPIVAPYFRRSVGTGVERQYVAIGQSVLRMGQERLHVGVLIIRARALPKAHGARCQVVIAKGVGRKIAHLRMKSLTYLVLGFKESEHFQPMIAPRMVIVYRQTGQRFLALIIAPISLTVRPYEGRIVM